MVNNAFNPAQLASNIAFTAVKKTAPKPVQKATPTVLPKTGADLGPLSEGEASFAKAAIQNGFPRDQIESKILKMRDKSQKPNIIKDALGGLTQSAASIGSMVANTANKGFNALDKYVVDPLSRRLGADEGRIQKNTQAHQSARGNVINLLDNAGAKVGGNPDATAFKVAKGVGDLAQLFTPTGEGKIIAAGVSKIPKVGAFAKGALEVAGRTITDSAKYSAIADKRLPTKVELAAGGVLNAGLKGATKIASSLHLGGLINPKDLTDVAKALHAQKDIAQVGKWMLDKGMIGSKDTIINKLSSYADDSFSATQTALSKSTTRHKVPEAQAALTKLKQAFGGSEPELGLEDLYTEVKQLLKQAKGKGLDLKGLDRVQKLQGEYLPNFVKAGSEVKDTLQAKANANLYNKVKLFIESKATEEGIGNIKELKKNTQLAHMLKNAITKKEAADYSRQLVSPFAGGALGAGTAAIGSDSSDPMTYLRNIGIGTAIGAAANNKAITSNLANWINKAGR